MENHGLPSNNSSIQSQLTALSFLQYFVWGAWLITVGKYCTITMKWSFTDFGAIFTTMGISSVFMPSLMGIVADKWLNAERLLGILHALSGISVACLPLVKDPSMFFWVTLLAMIFYMPTIALSNSVSYSILGQFRMDPIKTFPPIRVFGTVGFIIAMWVTDLTGNSASENQFYISAICSIGLGLFSFFLPKCPPKKDASEAKSFIQMLGLDAFKLMLNYKILLFFLFSLMLGCALQLTNMYGDTYLSTFESFPEYAETFAVKHSTVIMSISQISETLFILAIPFFLRRFGIKNVMLMSMFAWVLRFGLFAYGNPGDLLWMIVLSCVVYGMAFDFFNISGSLFVNSSVASERRSSAQGLFMMMTNGFGAILGSAISGRLIDAYFTKSLNNVSDVCKHFGGSAKDPVIQKILAENPISSDGTLSKVIFVQQWEAIWLCFAGYALAVAILFALLFRHKHNPEEVGEISH
ncbi:MAG: nucleoside permease [Bacteroidetes bacterium]|nr:nucleoside permease [Bacteroidota bacterium]